MFSASHPKDTQFYILAISGSSGSGAHPLETRDLSLRILAPDAHPHPIFLPVFEIKMFLLLPKQKWYPERNYRALQPEAKLNGDTVHFFTSRQHWTACSPRKSLHGGGSAISCIWTFFLTLPLLEHHSCLKISLPPLLWKQEHKCSFGKCIRVPLFPPPSHRAK